MEDSLNKYWVCLQAVAQIKNKKARRDFMKILSRKNDFRKLMKLLMSKIYHKEIAVSDEVKTKLNKHKSTVVRLSKHPRGKRGKRDIEQVGGFIQFLLPALAPLVVELIANAATSKV